MTEELLSILEQLKHLLSEGGEPHYVNYIQKALEGGEEDAWEFLCSNELWGGAGSVADQALLENDLLRQKLEKLLVQTGELQQKVGRVNVRTEMWVSAFSKQQKLKII